jgi:excisionase family DNA binding protein
MDKILRADEVAEILSVSKGYVYLLLARGQLPCIRIGKSRRIRLTDLDAFISRNIFLGDTKLLKDKESVP